MAGAAAIAGAATGRLVFAKVAADGHLVVLHGDRVIGTLREIDGGPQHGDWFWSITDAAYRQE
jgi:hypothetical protein